MLLKGRTSPTAGWIATNSIHDVDQQDRKETDFPLLFLGIMNDDCCLIVKFENLEVFNETSLLRCLNDAAKEMKLALFATQTDYVLRCTVVKDVCLIWFKDKHDCSYGTYLNGTVYNGSQLDIRRRYEAPEKENRSYLEFHNQILNPYILSTRYSRLVFFHLPKVTSRRDLVKSLNEAMQDLNWSSSIYSPVLYAKCKNERVHVECRTIADAVNLMNLSIVFERKTIQAEAAGFNHCLLKDVPEINPDDVISYYALTPFISAEEFNLRAGWPTTVIVTTCMKHIDKVLQEYLETTLLPQRQVNSNFSLDCVGFKRFFVEFVTVDAAINAMVEMTLHVLRSMDCKVEFFFYPESKYHNNDLLEYPTQIVLSKNFCCQTLQEYEYRVKNMLVKNF